MKEEQSAHQVPMISRENQHGQEAMGYHPKSAETVSRQNFTVLRRIRNKIPDVDPRKHQLLAD